MAVLLTQWPRNTHRRGAVETDGTMWLRGLPWSDRCLQHVQKEGKVRAEDLGWMSEVVDEAWWTNDLW